jgi:hypothetical protein
VIQEDLAKSFLSECDDANFKISSYKVHLNLNPQFCKGHSGSDIGPLTSKLIVKAGLKVI